MLAFKRNRSAYALTVWVLWMTLLWPVWAAAAPLEPANTAAKSVKAFDHARTGYALTGAHQKIARCESCHVGGMQKGTPRDCQTCHTTGSRYARHRAVMPSQHIATGLSCDACHGTLTFSGARFSHTQLDGAACRSCHDGVHASGLPSTHLKTQAPCQACHNTSKWAAVRPDHSGFSAATDCSSCHNGRAAPGRPASHIPVAPGSCASCHSTDAWKPSTWSHTQQPVAQRCASCHSGAYPPADGLPAQHIPYSSSASAPRGAGVALSCDSCHQAGYDNWKGARLHASLPTAGSCAGCHASSAYGLSAKPSNALHTQAKGSCESCHTSTSDWAQTRPDHSSYTAATGCANCHAASGSGAKAVKHIPASANCLACHSLTAWKPSKWNHTQAAVAGVCGTCHSGDFPAADGPSAKHIPYRAISGGSPAACDQCHKNVSNWTSARLHQQVTITTQCASCHLNASYAQTPKPKDSAHSSASAACESCHTSVSSWAQVGYVHASANAVGSGTCNACHNRQKVGGLPEKHVPVPAGVSCDACHQSQQSFKTAQKMNHLAVAEQACKACHVRAYAGLGALTKSLNHIPEAELANGSALDCKACHAATTPGGFAQVTMNHNNSQGNGSGWCHACHNVGTAYQGDLMRELLSHRAESALATDCSQSGCHRPLGPTGSSYQSWK